MKINCMPVVELVALDNSNIKYSTVQNCIQVMKMVKEVFIILLQKEVFGKGEKFKNGHR